MGYQEDVLMAKEMYILAYDALTFYANRYVKRWYEKNGEEYRTRKNTMKIKDSYMRGFLKGLSEKLNEQFHSLQEQYGLMVLTPKKVINKYDEMFKDTSRSISYKIPPVYLDDDAFISGKKDGQSVDYRKETINKDIVTD